MTTAVNSGASILSQYAISPTSGSSTAASAAATATAAAAATQQTLGENDFLTMMMAQLQNQDPLNPMDNSAFVAQLAQFSQVSGIQNLNTTMSSLSSNMTSNQALQASSLIGKQVYVNSSQAVYNGQGSFSGFVTLPQSTDNLTLQVSDASGAVVQQIALGTQAAGSVPFTWNGSSSSGASVPAGTYQITATADIAGKNTQLATVLPASVNSVSFSSSGGAVQLNLQGLGTTPLSSVQQIAQ